MGKKAIKVVIRTRPTASFASDQIVIDPRDGTIIISSKPKNTVTSSVEGPCNRKDQWKFRFHETFHNTNQEDLYRFIGKELVDSVITHNVNGTIIAYGQTGSGKSFTMLGDTKTYELRGLIPRCLTQIFDEIANHIDIQTTVRVSYIEIYNDRIFDLLVDPKEAKETDYTILDDAKMGITIRGVKQVVVESEKEALDRLFQGEKARTMAEHQLNKHSNRSHCLYIVYLAQKSRMSGIERTYYSKLTLVDLAGNERLKKTMKNTVDTDESIQLKKESMHINQSLTYLEQCVLSLNQHEATHIPYRQTKLTNILKDSLGGNSNTIMLACIWGESRHLEETISTLSLAQRMMHVKNEIVAILETDPKVLIRKYEKQIVELKLELAMHNVLSERSNTNYDELTTEKKAYLQSIAEEYLNSKKNDDEAENHLPLTSMLQIKELFHQMKLIYQKQQDYCQNNTRYNRAPSAALLGTNDNDSMRTTELVVNEENEVKGVGERVSSKGMSLGLALKSAKPTSIDINVEKNHPVPFPKNPTSTLSVSAKGKGSGKTDHSEKLFTNKESSSNSEELIFETMNDAFKYFKLHEATSLGKELKSEKQAVKEVREQISDLTKEINACKSKLDDIQNKIKEKEKVLTTRLNSTSSKNTKNEAKQKAKEEVLDAEQFQLYHQEKETKKEYRKAYEEFTQRKEEYERKKRNMEITRITLLEAFRKWQTEKTKQQEMIIKVTEKSEMINEYLRLEQSSLLNSSQWHENDGMDETIAEGKETHEEESEDDKLDDGEQFDQMEMERIMAKNPESLAFCQAQKTNKYIKRKKRVSPRNSPTSRRK